MSWLSWFWKSYRAAVGSAIVARNALATLSMGYQRLQRSSQVDLKISHRRRCRSCRGSISLPKLTNQTDVHTGYLPSPQFASSPSRTSSYSVSDPLGQHLNSPPLTPSTQTCLHRPITREFLRLIHHFHLSI